MISDSGPSTSEKNSFSSNEIPSTNLGQLIKLNFQFVGEKMKHVLHLLAVGCLVNVRLGEADDSSSALRLSNCTVIRNRLTLSKIFTMVHC